MRPARVLGVANPMSFPDDMDINDIRTFLQKKFTQRAVGGQSDALSPQDNVAAPYEPSLMERAGQGVADVLSDTGIISNRYGAQQIGKNVAAIGEILPGIGDVAAVDDFSRAAASGDKYGMALSALGVVPVAGDIAGKAGKKATKWFHGTGADFTDFDNKFLGTANPATDSSFGFYFGKSSDTADAYRPSTTSLNPDKYESTYGRTIEEGRARVIKGKAGFEKMFGMSHEDYTNLSGVERLKLDRSVDNIEAGGKQISNAESQLSPLHYEGHPYSLDEWVDEEKTGRIIEAELPTENMKEVDFGGKAWDEVKQSREARLAVDEGYDGVIFKDMQDSGWFGGSGTDDVALVFDANKIKQTSQAPVDVASSIKPADVNKLNPAGIDLTKEMKDEGFNLDGTWFHGSDNEFDEFDFGRSGDNFDAHYGKGAYFASKYNHASEHGKVKNFKLGIKNPMKWDLTKVKEARDKGMELSDYAKSLGHDGIIVGDRYNAQIVAFDNDQIKLDNTEY